MTDSLARLEPRPVWRVFEQILAIPRPSKHEERIVAWVRGLAADRGWDVRSDRVGNLVLRVPASAGRERARTVVLQGHLDMVCEKNRDTVHDFMRDPIRPRVVDGWLHASGTTLGADNGLGVAAAIAAATDPEVVHGPLELLFTLDEETGLTGAQGLEAQILEGRALINLDSEEDGKLFVGCAGGADCHLYLDVRRTAPPAGWVACRVDVRGLRGGHSGINIHENRGNAIKLLTRILLAAEDGGVEFELARIEGGSKHNAIPREAEAVLYLPPAELPRLGGVIHCMREGFRVELAGIDDGLVVEQADSPAAGEPVLSRGDRDRLLALLCALPHGVQGMSPALPGLVESSSNLAVVGPDADRLRIITSCRSSVNPTLAALVTGVRSAGRLAGCEVRAHDGYPGWKPDMASPLLALARRVFEGVWGRSPEVTAVHAGLECGLLGEKIPGLDMISFGPQIEGAHSPDERVEIASVARFWAALKSMLDALSRPAH